MYKFYKLCICVLVFCASLYAKEYVIDTTHSSVSFGVKHLSVADTIGHFEEFSGTLAIENNAIKNLSGKVLISSINTFNSARDSELRGTEFFQSKEATLQFISFKNNILRAKLTFNNATKEVAFQTKITGPIRNPSLDLKAEKKEENPFAHTDTTPFTNPLLAQNNNADCGCYISYGDNVIGVELTGSINRFDFHISPNTPKELLGETISIRIILEGSN